MLEKLKKTVFNYFSNGPKAAFLLTLVVIALITTIYSMRKTLVVVIDGKENNVITYKRTVQGALNDNNITLGEKDKIEPNLDNQIGKNDVINIKRAVNVAVEVDDEVLNVLTAEDSVESMLETEGITVGENDKVLPSKETTIDDGLQVDVVRVETKTLTETEEIGFTTVVKKDDSLKKDTKKVSQEGQKGQKTITTEVVYENGEETSKKVVSEVVDKEPVQEVVLQGTLEVLNLSRGGETPYAKSLKVRATAYSNSGGDGRGYTASGKKTLRDPNGYSTIAVDPRVIPLGTRLYVEGYGYAVAADTGGAIKGNTIDVFFNDSSEVNNWGVKYVNIYVLK